MQIFTQLASFVALQKKRNFIEHNLFLLGRILTTSSVTTSVYQSGISSRILLLSFLIAPPRDSPRWLKAICLSTCMCRLTVWYFNCRAVNYSTANVRGRQEQTSASSGSNLRSSFSPVKTRTRFQICGGEKTKISGNKDDMTNSLASSSLIHSTRLHSAFGALI